MNLKHQFIILCAFVTLIIGCEKQKHSGLADCGAARDYSTKISELKSLDFLVRPDGSSVVISSDSFTHQDSTLLNVYPSDFEKIYAVTYKLPSFSIIPNAYACSVVYFYEHQISSVTFHNKDTSHIKEKEITHLFDVNTDGWRFDEKDYISIPEMIDNQEKRLLEGESWYYRFIGDIQENLVLRFDITYTMTDGVVLKLENQEMRLKPH